MTEYKNPKWWSREHDSAWERVKAAFRRDWDQTKHDFGGNEPDTNQDATDTVKQAAARQPIPPRRQPVYEDVEPAYRFGYGAYSYYRDRYPEWNDELESHLRQDWDATGANRDDWARDRVAIREAWNYEFDEDAEELHHSEKQ